MADVSKLAGVISPLATPLQADESLDVPALERLVAHVLGAGVQAVFVAGSTGEFAALREETRRQAIEVVIGQAAGAVPVLVGVGEAGSERAAGWARIAQVAGADAVVGMLPYYYSTATVGEVVAHFEHIAAATSLPVLLYNIPSRTKDVIPLEAVARLRRHDQVVGIKDSAEEMNHFYRLLQMAGPGFRVFQGSEMQAGISLLLGADGVVLGMSNIAPGLCVRLYQAAAQGDIAGTKRYQDILADLNRLYWLGDGSVYGNLKCALHHLGICAPHVSRPLARPSAAGRAQVEALLEKHRAEL